MKKQNLLFVFLLAVMAVFISSCETDEEQLGPTLQFFSAGGIFIDQDKTVEPGDILRFSFLATKGDNNLRSMDIQRDGAHLAGYPMEDILNDNYQDTVTLEAPVNEGTYEYLFIVTDRKDLSDSAIFMITVEKTYAPVGSWTDVTLEVASATGATTNNCASVDGTVFSYSAATADANLQEKADFVYYYLGGTATGPGDNGRAIIAAPSAVSSSINNGYEDWTTKNVTEFYEVTLSGTEFSGMEDEELILERITGDPIDGNKVEGLAVDDIYGFMTSAGKKGFFRVTGLVPGWGTSAGQSITIDIKVQQTAD